jgi:hypothetical protein
MRSSSTERTTGTLAEILPQLEPIAEEFPEIPDPPVRSEDVFRP